MAAQAGHFTVVAVTRPFEFEGRAKVAAAGELLDALQGEAHMTVVVEQEVKAKVATTNNMRLAFFIEVASFS